MGTNSKDHRPEQWASGEFVCWDLASSKSKSNRPFPSSICLAIAPCHAIYRQAVNMRFSVPMSHFVSILIAIPISIWIMLSPYLFKQFKAFLGDRISGHHLAVMSLDPDSVQQSCLGQLAQPAFSAGRRNFYSSADVMAVEFPGFAVLTGAGAYAAAVLLDQSQYGQPIPGKCLQNHD